MANSYKFLLLFFCFISFEVKAENSGRADPSDDLFMAKELSRCAGIHQAAGLILEASGMDNAAKQSTETANTAMMAGILASREFIKEPNIFIENETSRSKTDWLALIETSPSEKQKQETLDKLISAGLECTTLYGELYKATAELVKEMIYAK